MPKYTVSTADGRKFAITAPEGASQADVLGYAQSQLGLSLPSAPAEEEQDNFSNEDIINSARPNRGTLSAFGSGVSRGFTRLGSTFGDILPAMGASALGFDDYAKRQMEEAAATEEQLQRTNPTQFRSLSDVKGAGDVLPFIGETVGEQVPNLLTSLIPGGVGASVGRRLAVSAAEKQLAGLAEKRLAGAAERQLLKKTAAAEGLAPEYAAVPQEMSAAARTAATTPEAIQASARSMAQRLTPGAQAAAADTGALAGLYLGSVAQNAPEIFQNIYDQTGGDLAPGAALIGGAIGGALDSILPAKILKVMRGNPALKAEIVAKIAEGKGVKPGFLSALKSGAVGAAKGIGTEGLTEAAQEAISIEAERIVGDNQEAWGSPEFDRLIESGVRGAVAGGVFGAGEGVGEHLRERGEINRQEEAKVAEEARIKAEQDAALKRQEEQKRLADLPNLIAAKEQEIAEAEDAVNEPENEGKRGPKFAMDTLLDEHKALIDEMTLLSMTPEERAAAEAKKAEEAKAAAGAAAPTTVPPEKYTPTNFFAELGITEDDAKKFIKAHNAETGKKFSVPFKEIASGENAEKFNEFLDIFDPRMVGYTGEAAKKIIDNIDRVKATHPNLQADAIETTKIQNIKEDKYNDYFKKLLDGRKIGLEYNTNLNILSDLSQNAERIRSINPKLASFLDQKGKEISTGKKHTKWEAEANAPPPPPPYTGPFTQEYLKGMGVTAGLLKRALTGRDINDPQTLADFVEALGSPDKPNLYKPQMAVAERLMEAHPELKAAYEAKYPPNVTPTPEGTEGTEGTPPPTGETPPPPPPPPPTGETPPPTGETPPPTGETPPSTEGTPPSTEGTPPPPPATETNAQRNIRVARAWNEHAGETGVSYEQVDPTDKRKISEALGERTSFDDADEAKGLLDDFEVEPLTPEEVARKREGLKTKSGLTKEEIEKSKKAREGIAAEKEPPPSGLNLENKANHVDPSPEEAAQVQKGIEGKTPYEAAMFIAQNAPAEDYRIIAERVAKFIKRLERAGVKYTLQVTHLGDPIPRMFQGARGAIQANKRMMYIMGADVTGKIGTSWNTVLHELIHIATWEAIGGMSSTDPTIAAHAKEFKEYVDHVIGVYNSISRAMKENKPNPLTGLEFTKAEREFLTSAEVRYGLGGAGNPFTVSKEFMAMALTSRPFQEFLESIPYKKEKGKTLFTKFVDLIRNILGIPAKANTALSEVLRHAEIFLNRTPKDLKDLLDKNPPTAEAVGKSAVGENAAEPKTFTPRVQHFTPPPKGKVSESIKRTFDPAERLETSTDLAQNADKIRNAVFTYLDDLIDKMPTWAGRDAVKWFLDKVENFTEVMRGLAFSLLSLHQLADVASFISPELGKSIETLRRRIAERNAEIDRHRERIEKFIDGAKKIFNKHPLEVKKSFDRIVHDSTRDQLNFNATDAELREMQGKNPEKYQKWMALKRDYDALPADVQKLYTALRDVYKEYGAQFRSLIQEVSDKVGALGTGNKILVQMLERQLDPYFPLWRKGDYWVQFIDPQGQENILAFERNSDRRRYRAQLISQGIKDKDIINFERITDLDVNKLPPTSQFKEVIKLLKENNVSDAVVDTVFQSYLNFFPSNSVMQQFRPREGKLGYREDALSALADVGTRMAMNVVQFDHVNKIDDALAAARGLMSTEGKTSSWIMKAIDATLKQREGYMKSPMQKGTWGKIASWAGYNNYRFFLLGNISSSIVNLTQLPIVTYSLLAGRYGMGESTRAMAEASKMFFRGGSDNNSTMKNMFTGKPLTDYTFFGTKADGTRPDIPKHMQELWQRAVNEGAIRRSTGQDLQYQREYSVKTEKEETGSDKILNSWNKIENNLSWVFQNSERFNREVTLLATYNLEYNKLKKLGKLSDEEIADRAATEAIRLVEEANGSSMSETGPALFQSDLGKIVGTFKRFALAQIYLASKLFAKAFAPGTGISKEERAVARRQFGYINGMAFAFAGIKGMPFFGGLNLIASAILGDDDEPFDLEGDILRSEASWALRGPISELLGVDISSRTGFTDLVWRDDPKRLAEVGMPAYVAELALGPSVGVVNSFRRGMNDIEQGHTERGIEAMLPAVVRNLAKAIRFGIEGATTKEGVKLVDDPNAYELVMQLIGFTPKELGDRYSDNEIMKSAQRNGLERRTALLARLNLAKQEGDLDEILEIRQKIQSFNTRGPGASIVKPITSDTISRSEKQFHVKQRQMAQTGGVYLGNPMTREVRNLRALVPDENED